MALTRRSFIRRVGGGSLGAGLGIAAGGYGAWLGVRNPCNSGLPAALASHPLVTAAWAGIDRSQVVDLHVHLVGLGDAGSGCWVNPELESWAHPLKRARFILYSNAGCIGDATDRDAAYLERLAFLQREMNPAGFAMLLPFDFVYNEDGSQHPPVSEFHTPDSYALKAVERYPDLFWAAASIHPNRHAAVHDLEHAQLKGARAIKWLPNAMRIDPDSPKCDAFYAKLVELKMPLLTHTGEEQAVEADEAQAFGNPLKLRRALDAGVTVIAAHCASLGTNVDLDDPAGAELPSFDLFMRLMNNPRYEKNLFAEISAMTQFNRCERPLREMIKATHLHPRCVYASDYPLPAINPLVRTSQLADLGYITREERRTLNELYDYNPLLFDFVLKRTLRVEEGGVTYKFADEVFHSRRVVDNLPA